MKIIDMNDLKGTERQINFDSGMISYRALLKKDGMGFTICKTVIPVGPIQRWHYKNHLEACYCICGEGILTNMFTGKSYKIMEDMLYVLDDHDEHTFEALEHTVLISVFNPPLIGHEVHLPDGSYREAA